MQYLTLSYHKITALSLLASFCFFTFQVSADKNVDWQRWNQFNPASTDEVHYGPLDSILKTVVVENQGKMQMRYAVLSGEKTLNYVRAYMRYMQGIPVSRLNRNEQLAYWLNLHNLGVIHMFASDSSAEQKVKKLRGVPGQPGEKWNEDTFTVEGQPLSLEDIEQRILFAQWHDPNTLYGLCYGVKGSPPIGIKAFRGSSVHAQLQDIGRDFVSQKANVRIKRKGIEVSSLYVWNKALLFDGQDRAIVAHIESLSDKNTAQKLSLNPELLKDRFSWRSVAVQPRQAPSMMGAGRGALGGGS